MSSPEVLTVRRLAMGLFVEYLGETNTDHLMVGIDDPPPVCDRQWYGHPGVIWEPAMQHVQVTWVGLEETVASFGVGYSCDSRHFYGALGVISAAE
ncbi:hypothetical protein [Actinoplanes sp. NPDC049118]|uniref:hypothetical protein n=1 Tax=Actinoplanes sp. NPDC049118 TaxID=3155769 RepID=UPI0033D72B6B